MDDKVYVEQKTQNFELKFDKFYDTPDCSSKFINLEKARDKHHSIKRSLDQERLYQERYANYYVRDEYTEGVIVERASRVNKLKEDLAKLEASYSFNDEYEYENFYETSFVSLTDKNHILEARDPIFVSEFDEAEEVISMNYPQLNIEFGDAKYFIVKSYPDRYSSDRSLSGGGFLIYKFPYIGRVTEQNVFEVVELAKKYGKVIVKDIDYRLKSSEFDSVGIIEQAQLVARRSENHSFMVLYYSPENCDIVSDRIQKGKDKYAKSEARRKKMAEERSTITSKGIKFWINLLISKYLCSVGMDSEITVRYNTLYPRDRNKDKVKIHLAELLDHLEIVCKSITTDTVNAFVNDREFCHSTLERYNDGGLSALRAFSKDPKTILGNRKNAARVFKIISKNLKVKSK